MRLVTDPEDFKVLKIKDRKQFVTSETPIFVGVFTYLKAVRKKTRVSTGYFRV